MEALEQRDKNAVEAAEGWLGLGSWKQAEAELQGIAPNRRWHPDVLKARWHIVVARGQWVAAGQIARAICTVAPDIPFGWVSLAYAAHKLNHSGEARNVLLSVVNDFPLESSLRYDLACYACHLGRLGEAWYWLQKAMQLPHSEKLDKLARCDPNLKALRQALSSKKGTSIPLPGGSGL
jgi:predicted Zn-dependent protease